jgi:NADPH2:quinone reductase
VSRYALNKSTGGPHVIEHETKAQDPQPGPGEALVEHRAIGVNYIDTYHRSGLYPLATFPSGLGVEASGTVLQVGAGVSEVRPGERVVYAGGLPGAYADRRVIGAHHLVPLPDDIDFEVAAASLLKGMTVEALVRRVYAVKSGDTVLLHAAAGGVGLIACQWLAHLGARVLATVGSEDKAELVRAHGASEAILYTREDFVKRVRELTSDEGVPVVYDSVGRSTFMGSLACLRRRGMLVMFGNASGKPEPLDIQLLAKHGSLFLTRPTLFDYIATREELLASAATLFDVLRSGAVKVRVGQRFPLTEVRAAHEALEKRSTTGSTVLLP